MRAVGFAHHSEMLLAGDTDKGEFGDVFVSPPGFGDEEGGRVRRAGIAHFTGSRGCRRVGEGCGSL